jgi:hypothetical protein
LLVVQVVVVQLQRALMPLAVVEELEALLPGLHLLQLVITQLLLVEAVQVEHRQTLAALVVLMEQTPQDFHKRLLVEVAVEVLILLLASASSSLEKVIRAAQAVVLAAPTTALQQQSQAVRQVKVTLVHVDR